MNIKKPLLLAGAISSVALASLAGAGAVSAATNTNDGPTNLIEKISQKFNLNKDEVKGVFDEQHATREAEHQKSIEEKLAQAVTDNKITSEQKDKIIAKLAELKTEREAERDAMKDKTQAERRTEMEAHRTELEKWATDNGIPVEYLRFGGGHHGHGGPGMGKPDTDAN